MNITVAFDREIGRRTFANLQSLQDALSEFSRNYGAKYKISNSLRYNEGDPRKQILVYSMANYSCVLKRGHQCPSYFRVEVRKGTLQVVERVMQHNHGKIAGDPEAVVDLTEQFNKHFHNVKLDSFSAVMAKVKSFEEATGSEFRVGRSDLFKPGEKERDLYRYRRITYECIHYGQRKSLARSVSECDGRTSWPNTSRLGCMAKFDIRYSGAGFKISAVVMKHNHKVSPSITTAAGRLCRRRSTQYHQRRCLEGGSSMDTGLPKDCESTDDTCSVNRTDQQLSNGKPNESTSPVKKSELDESTGESLLSSSNVVGDSPPLLSPIPIQANNSSFTKESCAPQPYWVSNPLALLSSTLPHRPMNPRRSGGEKSGVSRELSISERQLFLSGKMQRLLEKACHGDAKRFRECVALLDNLEKSWTKEDSML